jgi:glutamate synthase (NADPH/NADH) large chain
MILPKEHASRLACQQEMERAIKAEGQVLLGWRDVPVNRDMPMSPTVRRSLSCARSSSAWRRYRAGRGWSKLYVIRQASAAIQNLGLKHSKEYYVPSMSSRTVVYKGLLLADQVGVYLPDLADERCVSAIGLVHQRFSHQHLPVASGSPLPLCGPQR